MPLRALGALVIVAVGVRAAWAGANPFWNPPDRILQPVVPPSLGDRLVLVGTDYFMILDPSDDLLRARGFKLKK